MMGRKRLIIVGLLGTAAVYQLLSMFVLKIPSTNLEWKDKEFFREKSNKNEVIILRWTRFFNRYYASPVILNEKSCPYLHMSSTTSDQRVDSVFGTCRISFDRRYLPMSDAVVFHSFDLIREEIPSVRSSNQVWVYLQQESPIYTKLNLKTFPNVFNWTMSYRRDSDVYHPYGHIVPVQNSSSQLKLSEIQHFALKPRLAVWIVSSCNAHSNRQYLVHELQKYIPIDIFGWCGEDCPTQSDCYSHLSHYYKFYLSFENSLCEDYITEKFFKALEYSMVPVVYGGKDVTNYADIAPKDSYIDVKDFPTAKQLAEYLLYLDANDDKYLNYMKWKTSHQVIQSQGWCNLCQKVYSQLGQKEVHKWYKNLWKWWNYLTYDTNVEVFDTPPEDVQQSYYYKLGPAACKSGNNFNNSESNIEPGFLNGRIYGKLYGKVKHIVTNAVVG